MFSAKPRVALVTSVVVAVIAIFFSMAPTEGSEPAHVLGRNNTVLFIAGGASGLSNIHVAASYGLQEHAPHVRVHYASFAGRQEKVSRVSSMAIDRFPAASPISWHELPGPDYITALYGHIGNVSGLIVPPGLKGIKRTAEMMAPILDPFEKDHYLQLYRRIRDLIDQIDPAVVVLDMLLRVALDATRDSNRTYVMLSPNALIDSVAAVQPRGKALWKYPRSGSGIAYPVPWKLIPANVYMQFRVIIALIFDSEERTKRAYLQSQGIQHHDSFFTIKNMPWISMTIPEAGVPIVVRDGITECGPVVLDVANEIDENQELYHWLEGGPTVLINLGSLMKYDEARAKIMVRTIQLLLQSTDVRVLWKFARLGHYGDEFLQPLQQFRDNGRLRFSYWLEVEPAALLHSGQVVLAVHHGGANSFYEAIYAGVPQVVLPLWLDCYNYAQLAEYLGVGIWPGKDTAPSWDAVTLSQGLKTALEDAKLGQNARRIANASRNYGGRALAAGVISGMAAQGHGQPQP